MHAHLVSFLKMADSSRFGCFRFRLYLSLIYSQVKAGETKMPLQAKCTKKENLPGTGREPGREGRVQANSSFTFFFLSFFAPGPPIRICYPQRGLELASNLPIAPGKMQRVQKDKIADIDINKIYCLWRPSWNHKLMKITVRLKVNACL